MWEAANRRLTMLLSEEFSGRLILQSSIKSIKLKKVIKICKLARASLATVPSRIYQLFLIFMYFFFAHRDDFNIKVLLAFVDLHEFADLNLVQALR